MFNSEKIVTVLLQFHNLQLENICILWANSTIFYTVMAVKHDVCGGSLAFLPTERTFETVKKALLHVALTERQNKSHYLLFPCIRCAFEGQV